MTCDWVNEFGLAPLFERAERERMLFRLRGSPDVVFFPGELRGKMAVGTYCHRADSWELVSPEVLSREIGRRETELAVEREVFVGKLLEHFGGGRSGCANVGRPGLYTFMLSGGAKVTFWGETEEKARGRAQCYHVDVVSGISGTPAERCLCRTKNVVDSVLFQGGMSVCQNCGGHVDSREYLTNLGEDPHTGLYTFRLVTGRKVTYWGATEEHARGLAGIHYTHLALDEGTPAVPCACLVASTYVSRQGGRKICTECAGYLG